MNCCSERSRSSATITCSAVEQDMRVRSARQAIPEARRRRRGPGAPRSLPLSRRMLQPNLLRRMRASGFVEGWIVRTGADIVRKFEGEQSGRLQDLHRDEHRIISVLG
jgi:hypothetical protein